MEDISIPGWALIIFGVIILPWMVWLTLKVIGNEREIAVNTATDAHVAGELTKIYNMVEKQHTDTRDNFQKLEVKIDMFFAQEVNFFKQMVNR